MSFTVRVRRAAVRKRRGGQERGGGVGEWRSGEVGEWGTDSGRRQPAVARRAHTRNAAVVHHQQQRVLHKESIELSSSLSHTTQGTALAAGTTHTHTHTNTNKAQHNTACCRGTPSHAAGASVHSSFSRQGLFVVHFPGHLEQLVPAQHRASTTQACAGVCVCSTAAVSKHVATHTADTDTHKHTRTRSREHEAAQGTAATSHFMCAQAVTKHKERTELLGHALRTGQQSRQRHRNRKQKNVVIRVVKQ